MRIPYGVSNFKVVISEGYTYVDKTAYIAELETAGRYQVLLRPRRFGKSLFISMLEYYYDVAYLDEFTALFGKLAIGRNPTPMHNAYHVLFLDFSGIATGGGHDAIYRAFNTKLNVALQVFLGRYGYDPQCLQDVLRVTSPHEKMEYFFGVTQQHKILLLIDEYDHFANALLAEDQTLFQSTMRKGGFVRSFYETLKAATQRGTLDRLFITGVTPLMLDSLTSGFNIAQNLSLQRNFNAAMGFTQVETQALLQPLVARCQLDAAALMADVTRWYNGYRFHAEVTETVYNSDMVLYFIQQFDLEGCRYPKRMLDDNIASDYGKIMALFNIGDPDANQQVLHDLINVGEVVAQQRRKFELDKGFDRDDFISLLAYMGFVALQGETLSGEIFAIPNHVIEELYFQYFKVELEQRNQIRIANRPLGLAIEALALQNNMQPLAHEMSQVLQQLSNRDALRMDEKHIKTLLLTLLYQFPVYFIQSEREMNRRYPDILLLERSPYAVNHQHLIELKYSKKGDKDWDAKRAEGVAQVQGYLQLPEIAVLAKLSAWLLLTDGERLEVVQLN